MKLKEITLTDVETVLAKVRVTDEGCYLFPYINSLGYAQLQTDNRYRLVHRLMKTFDLQRDLLADEVIHHKCDNKNCVNPSHLKVMTSSSHSYHHNRITEDDDVVVALDLYFGTNLTLMEVEEELEEQFGINMSYSHLSNIINKRYNKALVVEYMNKNRDLVQRKRSR